MKFEKIKHFESAQMTDNQIRSIYGGECYTDGDDFIDNCGWTTYPDCRKEEDGECPRVGVGSSYSPPLTMGGGSPSM